MCIHEGFTKIMSHSYIIQIIDAKLRGYLVLEPTYIGILNVSLAMSLIYFFIIIIITSNSDIQPSTVLPG